MDQAEDRAPTIVREASGLYRLAMSTVICRPLSEVFEFLSDATNLNAITPRWVKYKILTPMPVEMREGAIFDYSIRIRGFPVRWRTEITEWSPPNSFTDTQVRGPFKRWRDRHIFTELDEGITRVENDVHYSVLCGALTCSPFVHRGLIAVYRHEQESMHRLIEN